MFIILYQCFHSIFIQRDFSNRIMPQIKKNSDKVKVALITETTEANIIQLQQLKHDLALPTIKRKISGKSTYALLRLQKLLS